MNSSKKIPGRNFPLLAELKLRENNAQGARTKLNITMLYYKLYMACGIGGVEKSMLSCPHFLEGI